MTGVRSWMQKPMILILSTILENLVNVELYVKKHL